MKTMQGFTEFYNKSKNRDSNKNNGRDACNDWLSFFASKSSPRWLSAMTVANLANAMRNYQINKKNNIREINTLLDLIDNFVMNFNPQGIANTLLSLNHMGLSFVDIESKKRGLGNNLLDSALRNVSDFNSQEIANTLLSLNQMGLSWSNIESRKRGLGNNLLEAVSRNVSNFNPQEIANTILSINQMDLGWVDIESTNLGLGNNLLDSVLSNVSDFNPQEIANTLLSLNQMDLSLDDIEAKKRGLGNNLLEAVSRDVSNFNPQSIANTLLSLNQMGLSWVGVEAEKPGLGNKLLDSVSRDVSNFNPQGIANTLLSLNQMGLILVDIESKKPGLGNNLLEAVSRNLSDFNPQGIANTLLSYTRMISDISMTETEKDTHRNTLTNLFAQATLMYVKNELSNIELTQISEALTWSRVYGFSDYSESFSGVNLEIKTIESRLQKDVTVKLKGLVGSDNLEVEKGFGFADCLVVDCYIRPCNLVVEIDGPDHYDKDGGLNYASRQRQTLLEELGLKVERIKYSDWGNTSEIAKINLLKNILDKHEPTSVASKFGIFSGSTLRADAKEFVPPSLRP